MREVKFLKDLYISFFGLAFCMIIFGLCSKCIAQAQQTLESIVLQSPGSRVGIGELGAGFDPNTPFRPKSIPFSAKVMLAENSPLKGGGVGTKVSVKRIESLNELEESRCSSSAIAAHAAWTGGSASVSAQWAESHNSGMQARTVIYVCSFWNYAGYREIQPISVSKSERFNEDGASALANGPAAFVSQFGSEFIDRIHYGSLVNLEFTAVASKSWDVQTVAKAMDASLGFAVGANGSVSSTQQSSLEQLCQNSEMHVEVFVRGGVEMNAVGSILRNKGDINSLLKTVSGLITVAANQPAPIGFRIQDFHNIEGGIPIVSADFALKSRMLTELYSQVGLDALHLKELRRWVGGKLTENEATRATILQRVIASYDTAVYQNIGQWANHVDGTPLPNDVISNYKLDPTDASAIGSNGNVLLPYEQLKSVRDLRNAHPFHVALIIETIRVDNGCQIVSPLIQQFLKLRVIPKINGLGLGSDHEVRVATPNLTTSINPSNSSERSDGSLVDYLLGDNWSTFGFTIGATHQVPDPSQDGWSRGNLGQDSVDAKKVGDVIAAGTQETKFNISPPIGGANGGPVTGVIKWHLEVLP